MSRLSNLLRQVETLDPQLAANLKLEMEALSGRRAFGLNFEHHIPETVELPGRPVRKGDKVRFLPERGEKPSSVEPPAVAGWPNSPGRRGSGGRPDPAGPGGRAPDREPGRRQPGGRRRVPRSDLPGAGVHRQGRAAAATSRSTR